jgi:predicted peroxiredoxin
LKRLARFVSTEGVQPYISPELAERIARPVGFITSMGAKASGYDAEVFVGLCEAVFKMRSAGGLQKQQIRIADRCGQVIQGVSRYGIIAMVDEATGYQYIRRRDELHKILAMQMPANLLAWSKRLPDLFYAEIYRLMGWNFLDPKSAKKPHWIGKLVSFMLYDRLPEEVAGQLAWEIPEDNVSFYHRSLKGRDLSWHIDNKYLEKQLIQMLTLLRISDSRREFVNLFRKHIARDEAQGATNPA